MWGWKHEAAALICSFVQHAVGGAVSMYTVYTVVVGPI